MPEPVHIAAIDAGSNAVRLSIARGVVRGINRDYLPGHYAMALRPHLTFWLTFRRCRC